MSQCPGCGKSMAEGHTFCVDCGTHVPTSEGGTGAPATPEERVGSVRGNYELLRILGEGGMGTVYLAEHQLLGRQVALKMLHADCCGETLKRFFAEARAVNQIAHDHIIDITDFVEDPAGGNFYVMELLDGHELQDLMAEEGVMPLGRSLPIAAQIASALSAVHAAGIIHRDLKPANVFLIQVGNRRDFVKLLDFGVAKYTTEGISMHKTASGVVVGTPLYMSPEQTRGEELDQRLDVYALGVILYQLVAGSSPYDAASFGELVIMQATQDPLPPSAFRDDAAGLIPEALDDLILRCLAREVDGRPASMEVVGVALDEIIANLSPAAANDTGNPNLFLRSGNEEDEFSSDGNTLLPMAGGGGTVVAGGGGGTEIVDAASAPKLSVTDTGLLPARPRKKKSQALRVALIAGLGLVTVAAVGYGLATGGGEEPAPAIEGIAANGGPALTIELRFRAVPEAEVFRDGKRLGATPLDLKVTAAAAVGVFELRHDGTAQKRIVRLDHDQKVEVIFETQAAPSQPVRRPSAPKKTTAPAPRPTDTIRKVDPPTELRDPWAD